ncbi:MAG: hypothetical protein JW749_04925, partial [Sedimentisphaerales bacterium]|nr:hypothetical protein [Sedimentisphaerales bacterium]
ADYNNGTSNLYEYDLLGNRTLMTNGSQTTYESNRLNQYSRVDDVSFTYDKNGNLKYDGTHNYSYDYENRLQSSTNPTRWYRYDYQNRRVRKAIGVTEKYCYDGDQIIADYNSAGVIQRKYVYGPGIDEPICMLDVNDDNAIYYYHYDGLGSVVALSGLSRYDAISAGGSHNLALKANGLIVGWGWNYYGQAEPPAGNDYIATAAGESHSLALKGDNSIVGWGDNGWGQLPPPGDNNNYIAISGGAEFSIAMKSDGSIVGWTHSGGPYLPPPAGNDYVTISAGAFHSLALKSDGTIVGWGENQYGQATPPAGNDYVAIAAGGYHSLALKSDGSIVCCGRNNYGQATAPAGNDFVAVAAGDEHSLALKSDGSIVGWGSNTYGQAEPPAGYDYVAVSAGVYHSMALKSNGSIVAWGDNYCGRGEPPAQSIMVLERYSYDVFGKPEIRNTNDEILTTSALGNRYLFTGREYDVETGNYYYRARYYSPKLGRFLQPDPVAQFIQIATTLRLSKFDIPYTYLSFMSMKQFLKNDSLGRFLQVNPSGRFLQTYQTGFFVESNLYRYCWNNPLIYVDQYGLGIWTWVGGAFEATGGGLLAYAAVATAPAWVVPVGVGLVFFGIGNQIGDMIFDNPLEHPPGGNSFTSRTQELEKECEDYPSDSGR